MWHLRAIDFVENVKKIFEAENDYSNTSIEPFEKTML